MNNNIKISVIGLGYVGLQVSIAFAKIFKTIGYDIDSSRIKELKKNIDKTKEVTSNQLKKSKIIFSNNIEDLKNCNFHILAVPTPIDKHNKPDLKLIINASKAISKIIKNGDIIVYESTVYPGLTEEICIPVLEKYSGLINNKDFYVGYSPERINPGDKKNRYEKINKIVSAQNKKTLNLIHKVYQQSTKGKVIKVSSIKVAEAAKIIENTQRDINVALINELSKIFRKMNIDTSEVLKASATKWNFLNFRPGLVGGHCIGVDPYYLTFKAKQVGINPKLILASRKINDQMAQYIVSQILSNFKKKKKLDINILGLTFKENCADIRNSKVLDIIKLLKTKGHNINLFDPFIDQIILNKNKIKVRSLNKLDKADVIIIAVKHKNYLKLSNDFFIRNIKSGGLIFDVKSSFSKLNKDKYKKFKYLNL